MAKPPDPPKFRTRFDPRHGEAVTMAPAIVRVTANNPSPFTFHGTNTYLLGRGDSVAVIDPGPALDNHWRALERAIAGRAVSHILVTHTHVDHSPLAARLAAATGARTYAQGPHRPARPLHTGEVNPLDASADTDFAPDVAVGDGEVIEGPADGGGWRVTALHTPGHTANHCAFACEIDGARSLFSGDHVMAWATSIVAPPDGSMSDYVASLDRVAARPEETYWPGHGGRVENAPAFVRALKAHRRMREAAVLEQVRAGRETIPDMVRVIYATTDPKLHGAAGLSVLAQLEDLVARGVVETDGPPALEGRYRAGRDGAAPG